MYDITIYTTNTCGSCHMVKKLLTLKNIIYKEVNLDESPEMWEEAISLSNSRLVPVTLITRSGSQDVIQGYNPTRLMPILAELQS